MNFDVYLAAPFFSEGERAQNEKILRALEDAQLRVFYPARDGIIAKDEIERGKSENEVLGAVWDCDISAIDNSKVILAVLDGRSVDEGVCVEIGYASARGKAIYGYFTDDRSCFSWGLNPMVSRVIKSYVSNTAAAIGVIRELVGP